MTLPSSSYLNCGASKLYQAKIAKNDIPLCIVIMNVLLHVIMAWVKVQNFQNPELMKINYKTCRMSTNMDNLN